MQEIKVIASNERRSKDALRKNKFVKDIKGMTILEVDEYIDKNITDIDGVKFILRWLVIECLSKK